MNFCGLHFCVCLNFSELLKQYLLLLLLFMNFINSICTLLCPSYINMTSPCCCESLWGPPFHCCIIFHSVIIPYFTHPCLVHTWVGPRLHTIAKQVFLYLLPHLLLVNVHQEVELLGYSLNEQSARWADYQVVFKVLKQFTLPPAVFSQILWIHLLTNT